MKKICYDVCIKSYLNSICSQKYYDQMQCDWALLRISIINTCRNKGMSKNHAKKIFPPYINRILLANFIKLNIIFNYNNQLEEYEKKLAECIFNYDFNQKIEEVLSKYNSVLSQRQYDFTSMKGISTRSGKISEYFIQNSDGMNISTCFYCDSNYVNVYPVTINQSGKKVQRSIQRQFELDHFFTKEVCPITALSIFNLIPCCKICNGKSIKGNLSLNAFYKIKSFDYRFLSPSSKYYSFEENVKIRVVPVRGKQWNPKIGFVANSSNYQIRFITRFKTYKKEINAFLLEDRYNYKNHKNEALNLLDLRQKYSDSYITLISNTLAKHKIIIPASEIKEAIFHQRADKKNHRIFGKMKNDIIK